MSTWQKIVTGTKFLFGGFESAVDYLLNTVLNPYLQTEAVAANVKKAYNTAKTVYDFLVKYRRFCPTAWLTEYDATLRAVDAMVSVFEDGRVTREEIFAVVEAVQSARAAYMKD